MKKRQQCFGSTPLLLTQVFNSLPFSLLKHSFINYYVAGLLLYTLLFLQITKITKRIKFVLRGQNLKAMKA